MSKLEKFVYKLVLITCKTVAVILTLMPILSVESAPDRLLAFIGSWVVCWLLAAGIYAFTFCFESVVEETTQNKKPKETEQQTTSDAELSLN